MLMSLAISLISIHALCEEGDASGFNTFLRAICISIHALCEEGDLTTALPTPCSQTFLSTPSARRATRGHSQQ